MPRKSRLYVEGLPQLIQLVSHNHIMIFYDQEDSQFFLRCIDSALSVYHDQLHAYSLLDSTVLLLLTTKSKSNISRFIQYISSKYVSYYNLKYNRSGTLWASRYRSCLIEPKTYFLLVQQYVDLYPKIMALSEPCRCSSYNHNIGKVHEARITLHDEYLALDKTQEQQAIQYSNFLQAPFSQALTQRINDCLQQNCLLGTTKFCQEVEIQIRRPVQCRKQGRPRKYFYNKLNDWVKLENCTFLYFKRYCYHEIRLPLLENVKYIDQLSMSYDKDKIRNICCHNHQALLRDEGTKGLLRAVTEHQSLQKTTKVWYLGSMFRQSEHLNSIEQYQQLGVEAIGFKDINIELEQFMLQFDILNSLGLSSCVELKINTIGTKEEFRQYREALHEFYRPFTAFFEEPEWTNWWNYSPEKLISLPNIIFKALKDKSPSLMSYISAGSLKRFEKLVEGLKESNIPFEIDPHFYPANDYCHTIFEWRAGTELVCRGGRYDNSISALLNKQEYAYGFAFMLDSLMALIRKNQVSDDVSQGAAYIVIIPKDYSDNRMASRVGYKLRSAFPQLSIVNDYSNMPISSCIQNAKRLGCRFILFVHTNQSLELIDLNKDIKSEGDFHKVISSISRSLVM